MAVKGWGTCYLGNLVGHNCVILQMAFIRIWSISLSSAMDGYDGTSTSLIIYIGSGFGGVFRDNPACSSIILLFFSPSLLI